MDTTPKIQRDGKGRYLKGSGNPGGKPKGTKDKANNIKLAFFKVFDQIGGIQSFARWASQDKNRREFYKMLIQILPKDIDMDMSDSLFDKFKNTSKKELETRAYEIAHRIAAERTN